MHPIIVQAIEERYHGGDQTAIRRARNAGTFELILIALAQHDLLRQILECTRAREDRNGK